MHDELLVRVTHCRADLQEELHAIAHVQPPRLAVAVDGVARDQLHDHIRDAGVGGATIQQTRDIAMIEPREDLPLSPEALLGERAAHIGPHELDGDFGLVLVVIAHRFEHVTHTACAEHTHDTISADALSDAAARGIGSHECQRAELLADGLQECAGLVEVQQRLHFTDELRICHRLTRQKSRTLRCRQIHGGR